MDHPAVKKYLRDLFPLLVSESDRGAVLLGMSHIDEQLNLMFAEILPVGISNKRKKEIFSHTGPFGSISSKLDVAYVCRLLPLELVQAIHSFRKIRNDLAHKTKSFKLDDHEDRIHQIFSTIGQGIDVALNRMAIEVLMKNMLQKLVETKHPVDEGKPLFTDMDSALQYLSDNGEVLNVLDEQRLRWEIGIGIGVICGLIIYHRDSARYVLGESSVIGSLQNI